MAVGSCIFIVLVTFLFGSCLGQLKPGCKIETLRACGDDYVPYGKHPKLRGLAKSFDEKCANDKEQIACTLKFINECVDPLPQAVSLLAINALDEVIEATCVVGSEAHKNFLNAVGCMDSVGDKLHKCIATYASVLERAVVKAPAKEVVHYACCHYHDMYDCLSSALAPCEDVGAKKIMFGVIEPVFGETLSLVCGQYTKGSQSCKQLAALPQLGAKDRRISHFIELLIELAETIGKKH